MDDGSLLRSGSETWGPVSPDNVHETGVSPGGQSGSPMVAADAEQVERTRGKTWSRARSRFLCPTGNIATGCQAVISAPGEGPGSSVAQAITTGLLEDACL